MAAQVEAKLGVAIDILRSLLPHEADTYDFAFIGACTLSPCDVAMTFQRRFLVYGVPVFSAGAMVHTSCVLFVLL